MAAVFFGVGSNIERERHILSGLIELAEHFEWVQRSRVFESRAVGFSGSDFYNLVVEVRTDKSIHQVWQTCKDIEELHGRSPNSPKYSPRSLDIDMLLYDDQLNPQHPQLPRGEILDNAFVLWPLAEIAPDRQHPVQRKSYAQLWQEYRLEQELAPLADERWLPF